MIKKERLMTVRMEHGNYRPIPRNKMWLAKCVNVLTLIIHTNVDYDYCL